MKILKSNPKDTQFFSTYVSLIHNLKKAGYAAQVVSALTEIGGIFAAAYIALLPVVPAIAVYFAAIIAGIGTAVIELGLRKLLPFTVDSILYKRISGLHLPMTIFIWLSSIILIAASGILSFENSKSIVKEMTPDAQKDTTAILATKADLNGTLAVLETNYQKTKQEVADRYAGLKASTSVAFDGKIKAKRRDYANLKNKEKRTGNSYATKKDDIKAQIAKLEAESALAVAELESQQANELASLLAEYRKRVAKHESSSEQQIANVEAAFLADQGDRTAKVKNWGAGLAWFTIVALIVLVVSIILDRIHVKGSDIKQSVELSQRDISPSLVKERWNAWKERQYTKQMIKIAAYRKQTPALPAPFVPAPIYDPTKLMPHEVRIEQEAQEEEVVKIPRRKIGFGATHESSDLLGTRKAHDDKDVSQWKKRLKQYKKRLGIQEKKMKNQLNKDGVANSRTLAAIENNKHWVAHYQSLIDQVEG
jgi:major membrane immunogen (membrane-anchored lipoprotein)